MIAIKLISRFHKEVTHTFQYYLIRFVIQKEITHSFQRDLIQFINDLTLMDQTEHGFPTLSI